MFRVKICGIQSTADAEAVAIAGGDAIGLNFFARSPRFVDPAVAAAIAKQTAGRLCRVGLFVNAPPAEVREVFDALALDLIQLHGDEPPAFLAELGGRPVMRAFRLAGKDLAAIEAYLAECDRLGARPRLVLLDAYRPDQFGGTGATVDWTAAQRLREQLAELPLVLAGGLVPANVAQAIEAVQPHAVDVASGVETSPAVKDPAQVAAFIQAARTAFAGKR